MNVSEVDIANTALSYVGEGPIQSFTERSNPAAVVSHHYPFAVAETLQAFPWGEAKARAELTALADVFIPRMWEVAYALPPDCIRPRYLVGADALPDPRFRQKFERYTQSGQQYIVTNLTDAHLIYTTNDITVDQFSPLLIDAIAWKLAMKIALPITRTAARLADAQAGWTAALSAAMTNSANEDPDVRIEFDPEWITDRGYAPDSSRGRIDNG